MCCCLHFWNVEPLCFFPGSMFLQPQRGAVRPVVSDGSAQMVQGGPTVSQRQRSRFCAAKGVKKPDGDRSGLVVLDQTGVGVTRLEMVLLPGNRLLSLFWNNCRNMRSVCLSETRGQTGIKPGSG